ncbi:hypothetical protein EYC84_012077 [Monilinia fructicola]|uniref:PHD-type domain-containing protein n=1 Tax=Monilinia fructicola TaxID=38448 RepID=A0A5M9J533_MONFR|nr:hypothetical protein EYC84_012077 [Monilinia fructicola]
MIEASSEERERERELELELEPHPHRPHHHNNNPGVLQLPQLVAQIKPCDHVLHDDCLREWSQKANSCPICRTSFNLVVVLDRVGGTVQSEYAVEDRKQTAEFDLAEWQLNNPEQFDEEEEVRVCPICEQSDQEDVLLLCFRCDAPYHTHCLGLSDLPGGTWYCMECVEDGAFSQHESIGWTRANNPSFGWKYQQNSG